MKWKSNDWLEKGDLDLISSLTDCPYKLDGLRAYACRQADVFNGLYDHFLGIWKGLNLPHEHLTEPIHPLDPNVDMMELDGDDA